MYLLVSNPTARAEARGRVCVSATARQLFTARRVVCCMPCARSPRCWLNGTLPPSRLPLLRSPGFPSSRSTSLGFSALGWGLLPSTCPLFRLSGLRYLAPRCSWGSAFPSIPSLPGSARSPCLGSLSYRPACCAPSPSPRNAPCATALHRSTSTARHADAPAPSWPSWRMRRADLLSLWPPPAESLV